MKPLLLVFGMTMALAGPVATAAPALAPVFRNCSAEFAASGNGVFCRPVWARLVSDAGETFRIDMKDLEPLQGGAIGAFVVIGDPQGGTNPTAFKHLYFDCRGHYGEFDDIEQGGGLSDAPPRSVVGQLAHAICPKGQRPPPPGAGAGWLN